MLGRMAFAVVILRDVGAKLDEYLEFSKMSRQVDSLARSGADKGIL